MRAWTDGDQRAGNKLFTQYLGDIQAFFRNKVAARDEDDLIQETFLGCVKNAAGFRGDSSFRTYLFRIAYNTFVDYLRKKSRRPDALDLDEISVADIAPGPSTLQTKRHKQALLYAALRAIPANDQVVIELFYWQDITAGQIGEILGVPEPTVRSRLRRAISKLRKEIARQARTPAERDSMLGALDRWAAEIHEQFVRQQTDEEQQASL